MSTDTHIAWCHTILRESGHCIDGGECHHGCEPHPDKPCWRKTGGCVPLSGSGLADDWTVPARPQLVVKHFPLPTTAPRPVVTLDYEAFRMAYITAYTEGGSVVTERDLNQSWRSYQRDPGGHFISKTPRS